ncbi:hypothetical protein PM082_002470 [Marasmius tenuissimus]|nr:hypothetical protein PM082_002470 [Marasmius tenuissimus]
MHRVPCCLGRLSTRPFNYTTSAKSVRYAGVRLLNTQNADFESKYAEKLNQRAEEKGVSITELKSEVKEKLEEEKARVRNANKAVLDASKKASGQQEKRTEGEVPTSARQDSSPVKPLSSILNLSRIASLNASQIGALWTAYHASRSEGTGRGFLCASIPVDIYEKMARVGAKYPMFVLPLPRAQQPTLEDTGSKETESAYEFYFMEWAFHEPPASPTATPADLFSKPSPQSGQDASGIPISTILFTPLIEYKMRNSFATPYLVLTHYTDLAKTHGTVLLRGEITPTSAGNGHMLSQEDAQVLSMGLQKFYLWDNTTTNGVEHDGEKMLKAFHENPDKFDWQELLKYGTQHL